jgi:hypothetical protein
MRLPRWFGFVLIAALWVAMMAIRQDPFDAEPRLVLGAIPVSLAYQAGYSLFASLVMLVLVRVAWPARLETLEDPPGREGLDRE